MLQGRALCKSTLISLNKTGSSRPRWMDLQTCINYILFINTIFLISFFGFTGTTQRPGCQPLTWPYWMNHLKWHIFLIKRLIILLIGWGLWSSAAYAPLAVQCLSAFFQGSWAWARLSLTWHLSNKEIPLMFSVSPVRRTTNLP